MAQRKDRIVFDDSGEVKNPSEEVSSNEDASSDALPFEESIAESTSAKSSASSEQAAAAVEAAAVAAAEQALPKLLILVKDPNRVKTTIAFLEKREIPAKIATSMNEAIAILAKREANLALLSVNFPHPKVEALPGLLQTSFNLESIVFAEVEDRKTTQKMQVMKPKWSILGPVSGPAVLMKIKQMQKKVEELANAANEASNKKASGEKDEGGGDIKISGKSGGKDTQVLRNSVIKSSGEKDSVINRIRSGSGDDGDISINGSSGEDGNNIRLRGSADDGSDANGKFGKSGSDGDSVNRLRSLDINEESDVNSRGRGPSLNDFETSESDNAKSPEENGPAYSPDHSKSAAEEFADMLGESAITDDDSSNLSGSQLSTEDLEAEQNGNKAADQETMVQKGQRAQLHEGEQEGNIGELNSAEEEGAGAGLPNTVMPDPDDIGDNAWLAEEFSDNAYDDLPEQAAAAPTAYGPLSGQTGNPDELDMPSFPSIQTPEDAPEAEAPPPMEEALPELSAKDVEPEAPPAEEAPFDPTPEVEPPAEEEQRDGIPVLHGYDEEKARDSVGKEVELDEKLNVIWESCRRSLAEVLGEGSVTLSYCRQIEKVGIVIVESADMRSTFLVSTTGTPQRGITEIMQPLTERLRFHLESFKVTVAPHETQSFELDTISFDVKHMEAGEFSISMANSVVEASLTHLNVSGFVPHFGAVHEDMTFVEIEHFPAEVRLDVDVFVHLPLNQRFVRYWKQNSVVSSKQVEKMKSFKVEKLLVKTVDVQKFKVFCVKNAIVEIANAELSKKIAA